MELYSQTTTFILFIIITITIVIKHKFAGSIIFDKVIFLIIHWQFIHGTTRFENKEENDNKNGIGDDNPNVFDELKEKLQVGNIILIELIKLGKTS